MAPALAKSLGRLSREAIIDLVLSWLKEPGSSTPYFLSNRKLFEADEEDYLHPPAESIKELEKLYRQFLTDSSKYKKQDIIDRIVDGDWRRGLSLHQHASIDFAHLEQNDNALRWTALKLVPLPKLQDESHEEEHTCSSRKRRKLNHDCYDTKYPQISPRTFVSSLRAEISPLVKAHFHIHRMPAQYGLTIIRLYITPDAAFRPRSSKIPRRVKHATDAGRVMYIALPDSCPFVYVSLSGSIKRDGRAKSARDSGEAVMSRVDMATMKKIILEAIPKAVSRPQERWALQSASLTARSLQSICKLRGNRKPGAGGGVYSGFASNVHASHDSPLGVQLPDRACDKEQHPSIDRRFGHMEGAHYAPLDRVHIKVEKLLKQAAETDAGLLGGDQGDIALTFSGSDVFLGVRKLAEMGTSFVDLDGMPAWMTGEVGVSSLST